MSFAAPTGAPSNLGAVLRYVAALFDAAGDATPIMIGAQYVPHFGAGSAPRVIFVPEKKGEIGPPIECGNAASVTHSCDFAVRGAEDGSDAGRFDSAYDLTDRVLDAISRACSGRHEWGALADDSPLNVDGLGADLAASFTYRRDVRHGVMWSVAPAADPGAAAFNTLAPNATPAATVEIEPATEVE